MTASLPISIAAGLVGIAGVLLALQADKRAEKANSIAQDALTTAGEANRIAGEANKLASDANTISERALNIASESIDYKWIFEINDDGIITIRNDNTSEAFNVTVFVKDEKGNLLSGCDDAVAPMGEVHLNGNSILEKHLKQVTEADRRFVGNLGSGNRYSGRKPVRTKLNCHIRWETPAGKELSTILDLTLCHRVTDEKGTITRFS